MSSLDLKKASVAELVDRFAVLGLSQYQARLRGEQKKLNQLMYQMRDVTDELKTRSGDQRSALLPLFKHPNLQVRLMAARLTLAVAPGAARTLLQAIADSKDYPQAMDAGMALRALDNGIFKPS
jgi:hypothetical protein